MGGLLSSVMLEKVLSRQQLTNQNNYFISVIYLICSVLEMYQMTKSHAMWIRQSTGIYYKQHSPHHGMFVEAKLLCWM